MSRRHYEDITDSDNEEDVNRRVRIRTNDEPAPSLLTDTDNFVEGSIVKITLTNFVTYDYCEIAPGPQMNMIIGPNGTGKSTIVCAIALGLGGSPNLLGRAKNIADFVKTGKDEATICIELKKINDRNVIIQRSFSKSNNQTTWKLNGRTTSQKDIMQIISNFHIQVDNLCQFLPQDRVSEFALLSPYQLLERTQSATGETEMYNMQMQLVELRNEEKGLLRSHESDLDHIKTLRNRNAELEKDATRMRQRDEIYSNITLLEAQKPLIKYSDAKKKLEDLRAILKEKREVVAKVKAVYHPIQRVIKECEDEAEELNEVKKAKENQYKEGYKQVKKIQNEIKELRSDATLMKSQIVDLKRRIPEKEVDINRIKRAIEKTEESLQTPQSSDTSELDAAIHELNEKLTGFNTDQVELQQKAKDLNRLKERCQYETNRIKQSMEELMNISKARLHKLKQMHPHTVEALTWLRNNKHLFKGRFYHPVMIVINLKDPRYGAAIEQCLGGANSTYFRTFIFEEREDYIKFTSYAVDQMKWKISVAWPDKLSDNSLKNPMSEERLKTEYGFDHFASNLIEGPEYVLKYLCSDSELNRIPVSHQQVNVSRIVESGLFKKFICGQSLYKVKRYSYGSGGTQTQVSTIKKSQILTDSLDHAGKDTLKEKHRSLLANIEQADTELKEMADKAAVLRQKMSELKYEKDDKIAQKREIQSRVQKQQRMKARIEGWRDELKELEAGPAEDYKKIEKLERNIIMRLDMMTIKIQKMSKLLQIYVNAATDRDIAVMKLEESKARLEAVKTYGMNQINELKEAERILDLSKKQYTLTERDVRRYMSESKEAGKDIPEQLAEAFREIIRQWKEEGAKMNLEELETEIMNQKAKAEAIRFANPNAIKHYEERLKEIHRLENKAHEDGEKIQRLKEKITELRAQWEPRIETLIARISEKFSSAFERIGCAGEVGLSKHEDYDKWGVEIQVRFRDNEKLQILDAHRQSGGEKSVSTILYLMSLQDLAKSPFRVVDEINQGMDARNERMIHEQIVMGASRPGTSQYFLITPKLLPDLYYNERIRVLCIYNGEWVPTKITPLSAYLKNARMARHH